LHPIYKKSFLISFKVKINVAIFSFFGKKPASQELPSSDKPSSKKAKSKTRNTDIAAPQDDEALSQSVLAQRHIARATERKIDAIEFEMSRDMGRSKTPAGAPSPVGTQQGAKAVPIIDQFNSESPASDFQSTLPLMMPATDYLLGHHADIAAATLNSSESVPLLEEASILFATGQNEVAEQMLQSAIAQDNLGNVLQIAWFMLFDLYQICNNRAAFDHLSLDYASKFETSPPVWQNSTQHADESSDAGEDGTTPSVTFPSKLDGTIIKLLEKLQNLSKQSKNLRLDFLRVKQVDPVGCGLLLRSLKNLKKTKHDLMLVGAQDFSEKIRAILQVGRRDETEAPWLLLLEILQLLHFEKAFEEASIDYCITFEVSPPSFEVPKNKVTTMLPEVRIIEDISDRFMMPAVIEGRTENLISQITAHAELHKLVLLDCSKLERVEFGASAQLLSGLVPIAGKKETSIQFHEVNYLVMNLFNAMGLKNVAAIFPRKH
jgi:ABC-type transporter Mla MlaB component